MSLALRQRASIARLAEHFGDGALVTVRRRHTLRDDQTGAIVSTMLVNGQKAAGSTSIDLDRAPRVFGDVPQGITFTIAGNATVYTVAARGKVATNAVTLTFSPGLAAIAADDAVVTFAATVEQSILAAVGVYRDLDRNGTVIELGDRKVLLDTGSLNWEIDKEFDLVVLPGETAARTFKDVGRYKGGTVEAGAKLQVGT